MLSNLVRYCQERSEQPTATVDVPVQVYDLDGNTIETLVYRVECEGWPGETPDVLGVTPLECGCTPETRRVPDKCESSILTLYFEDMQANRGRWQSYYQEQIEPALMKAIEGAEREASGANNPYSRNFEGY